MPRRRVRADAHRPRLDPPTLTSIVVATLVAQRSARERQEEQSEFNRLVALPRSVDERRDRLERPGGPARWLSRASRRGAAARRPVAGSGRSSSSRRRARRRHGRRRCRRRPSRAPRSRCRARPDSRIRAARPTAFGRALQGTQYSMRTCGRGAIDATLPAPVGGYASRTTGVPRKSSSADRWPIGSLTGGTVVPRSAAVSDVRASGPVA